MMNARLSTGYSVDNNLFMILLVFRGKKSIKLRQKQRAGYSVGWNLFRILLAFFDDFTFADSMELRKQQQLGYCRKILTLEVN